MRPTVSDRYRSSVPSTTIHGAHGVLVMRSTCPHFLQFVVGLETRPALLGDAPSRTRIVLQRLQPLALAFFERWNQNLSTSAPSFTSMASNRLI